MHKEQRLRTIDSLQAEGIAAALFAHPETVTWLTGFAPSIQLGQHHFAGGPSLVWYGDGHFYLIVLDGHVAEAHAFDDEPDGTVLGYEGYSIDHPIRSHAAMRAVLDTLLGDTLPGKGTIGIEERHLTRMMAYSLHQHLTPAHTLTTLDGLLTEARMVKTAEELAKLRENFRLTDIGHAVAREVIAPGKREIDVWTEIHSAINREAGARVPLGNDLVVSSRQPNNIGGWPLAHTIQAGDTVTVDLSTAYQGYWSDSCASYFASGDPTPEQQAALTVVGDALDYAISLIRPGAIASEVDAKVRHFIEKAGYPVYPHHTGHGVGVSVHEEPRIVPYNHTILQAGMVVMLEPGIYIPGQLSIRHEDGLLITSDGVEILTRHKKY